MIHRSRNRFFSQIDIRFVIAFACAALIFCARPALAQRGGGHAGGGGHWGGGGHFGGGHSWGGHASAGGGRASGRSFGGSARGWGESAPHDGIVVVSGARRGSGSLPPDLRGYVPRDSFRNDSREFAAPAAPRHTTIGFPPDSHRVWRAGAAGNSGAAAGFAGQGSALWEATPARRGPPGAPGGGQSLTARQPGQWTMQFGRRGRRGRFDRDGIFSRRFRHRHFFDDDFGFGFPFFDYPFYGYGLGLFSYCGNGLAPDMEWEEDYTGGCGIYGGQNDASIVSYGAEHNGYEPQPDTRQFYGAYASGNSDATDQSAFRNSQNGSTAASTNAPAPDTLIYLADGTNYAVTSYWLAGGKLHYLTSYGAEDSVPIGQIDLQRTVDANAAQGVQFTLRPAPAAGSSR
jgi:hypothetical protein